ncbi:hypothetical protein [Candidatus Chlorohelix sp.]|uniref:hypothetical protein n=1 Tax=Candidatus Chlorohelix sp. TaxID=3139201 RepID=UPI0030566E01
MTTSKADKPADSENSHLSVVSLNRQNCPFRRLIDEWIIPVALKDSTPKPVMAIFLQFGK